MLFNLEINYKTVLNLYQLAVFEKLILFFIASPVPHPKFIINFKDAFKLILYKNYLISFEFENKKN